MESGGYKIGNNGYKLSTSCKNEFSVSRVDAVVFSFFLRVRTADSCKSHTEIILFYLMIRAIVSKIGLAVTDILKEYFREKIHPFVL
jgi:hypothetical protein